MADEREDLILSNDEQSPLASNEVEEAPEKEQAADAQSPKFTGLESLSGGSGGEESLTAISEESPAAAEEEKIEAAEAAEPGEAVPSFLSEGQSPKAATAEEAETEEAEQAEESEEIPFSNDIAGSWEEEEADSEPEDFEDLHKDGLSLPDLEMPMASESAQRYTTSEKEPVFKTSVDPRVLYKGVLPQKDLIKNRRKYFWAVDIGSHTIKVIGFKRKRKGIELTFLSLVEILPGHPLPEREKSYQQAIINALNMAIKGIKKWQKGDFVSSIGANSAVVRQVQYPLAVKDKLLSAIQWEVRKFIPYEPEEVVVDAQILVTEDNKMDVLLAAVPKEQLKHHQTILSGGGLTSQTIDADSIALANAMMSQINLQNQETALLIDVGAKTTVLNMFQMGGLFFSRSLSIAGNRFTHVISSELKKEFSEAEVIKRGESGKDNGFNPEKIADILTPSYKQLYSEIQKSIMFYNKQTGVKDFHYLFLSGGGANLPGLREFLSSKLGKDIALLSPVAGLEVDEKNITKEALVRFGPQIALAVGLAYRAR